MQSQHAAQEAAGRLGHRLKLKAGVYSRRISSYNVFLRPLQKVEVFIAVPNGHTQSQNEEPAIIERERCDNHLSMRIMVDIFRQSPPEIHRVALVKHTVLFADYRFEALSLVL